MMISFQKGYPKVSPKIKHETSFSSVISYNNVHLRAGKSGSSVVGCHGVEDLNQCLDLIHREKVLPLPIIFLVFE